jgi:hypothetical protein
MRAHFMQILLGFAYICHRRIFLISIMSKMALAVNIFPANVFIGAVQDLDAGVVVGTSSTFGKGK